MKIGDRIRLARETKGWSQEQLADAINVETPTVSRWETGLHEPRPRHWPVIVNALGRSREWFEGIESDRISGLEARIEKIESISRGEENLTEDESELIGLFRGAGPAGRAILDHARNLVSLDKAKGRSVKRRV